jgi:hypothetical protein
MHEKILCQWIQNFRSLIDHRLSGFDFFIPHSPSTQAYFGGRKYFFRTGSLHFLDFFVKNHLLVQFKIEFIQFLLTAQKSPFK